MAYAQVQTAESKKADYRGLAGTAGSALMSTGNPYAMAAGTALSIGSQLAPQFAGKEAPQPYAAPQEMSMPDYSQAIARREKQLAEDPYKNLVDARSALASLDVDEETRLRLQKPLDAAIAAQRSIG